MKIHNPISTILLILATSPLNSQGILIGPGTQVVADGNVHIVLKNAGFTNNGQFIPGSSTLRFTGNNATSGSFLSGNNAITLYNLVLDKTSNGIQLNRDISVSNQVVFNSGDSIFLNNYVLDLGSTGNLVNESNAMRITGRTGGYVQATHTLNAPLSATPGNLGIQISSTANLGATIIRRGHKQQGGISVFRYFDIIPTNNNGLNAQLVFSYFDNELAGIGEGNLAYFQSFNNGVGYTNLGLDNLDISSNSITKNNIDQLSRFTLSNISLPLAVTLLDFRANINGEDVILTWLTTRETDLSHYILERSEDRLHFGQLARINNTGNGAGPAILSYHFTDQGIKPGKYFYRLKMVDIDGRSSYSSILSVTLKNPRVLSFSIYPNPAATVLNLRYVAEQEGSGTINIYNAAGGLVKYVTCHFIRGYNETALPVNELATGIYQVWLCTPEGKTAVSFIKK